MRIMGRCLAIAFAVLAGCSPQEPIRIGFAANLTGRAADTGVDARDGALLAVEEINAQGGIGGRKIELIVKDDQNNPEIARKISQELIDAKVSATIGHVVSGMTQAALPLANEKKMLLVSPTSVSNTFTGKDDFLIRVSPAAKLATTSFADFAFQKKARARSPTSTTPETRATPRIGIRPFGSVSRRKAENTSRLWPIPPVPASISPAMHRSCLPTIRKGS